MTRSKMSSTLLGAALTLALSTVAFATPASAEEIIEAPPAPPVITWTTTIVDGASYVYGDVPAAPTCAAAVAVDPAVVLTCEVQGYGTEVGSYTLTTLVKDATGVAVEPQATDALRYTVTGWDLKGFYSPVKMGADVWNVRKAGSTVPLKFKVYVDGVKEKSPDVLKSFLAQQVDCTTLAPIGDPTAVTKAAKGFSLKYRDGAFHQNWKTPKLPKPAKVKGKKVVPAACYLVTMTTQDGSALTAKFRLK